MWMMRNQPMSVRFPGRLAHPALRASALALALCVAAVTANGAAPLPPNARHSSYYFTRLLGLPLVAHLF